MNAEKMIKTEAKRALSGNWIAAETSLFVMLFLPLIAALIVMAAYGVLGDAEAESIFSDQPITAAIFVGFHVLAAAAVLLLSPIFTGFVRLYGKIASGEESEVLDVFYYFESSKNYKRALAFMSLLLVKCVGILLVCEAPAVAVGVLADGSDMLKGTAIALACVGLVAAFLWVQRFIFQMALFACKDHDGASAVQLGAEISKGNTGKIIKLTLSFTGWILLTATVVPFLYIYPYMTTAYFVAAKYIISDFFERKNAQNDIPAVNAPEAAAQPASDIADQSADPPANAPEEQAEAPAENTSDTAQPAATAAVTLEKSAD